MSTKTLDNKEQLCAFTVIHQDNEATCTLERMRVSNDTILALN